MIKKLKLFIYIAETQQVARYTYDTNTGKITNTVGKKRVPLATNLVTIYEDHIFRCQYAQPDLVREEKLLSGLYSKDKLYISSPASCDLRGNTWKRAAILESDPEGTVTAGCRRIKKFCVFTFHSETGEMWATEMRPRQLR